MPQMTTALTTTATTTACLLDLPDRCSASFNALAIMWLAMELAADQRLVQATPPRLLG
jgi:hypothetical protein